MSPLLISSSTALQDWTRIKTSSVTLVRITISNLCSAKYIVMTGVSTVAAAAQPCSLHVGTVAYQASRDELYAQNLL